MKKTSVTKRFTFSASHRLYNSSLSEEKNREIFQKCSNDHGHNFVLDVTVTGPINSETGMIINFSELKAIVDRNVILILDHSNFEKDLTDLHGQIHTAENMVGYIWEKIAVKLPKNISLKKLKLIETEGSWVELEESND